MASLLELHQEKKHFLNEFSQLNIREIEKFAKDNFEDLNLFYSNREKLLEIIQYVNRSINQRAELIPQETMAREQSLQLELISVEIKQLTQTILRQDLDILNFIETAKTNIIKELQNTSRNKKTMSSYKTKVDHHQIDEDV